MVIALRSRIRWSVLSVGWACVTAGRTAATSNSSRRIADLGSGRERRPRGSPPDRRHACWAEDPNTPTRSRSSIQCPGRPRLLSPPARTRAPLGAGRRLPPRGLDELDAKSLGLGELEIYPVAVAQPHPYGPALAVLSHDGPAEFAVDAVDLLALGHRGASAR